jgi:hypothetical protein
LNDLAVRDLDFGIAAGVQRGGRRASVANAEPPIKAAWIAAGVWRRWYTLFVMIFALRNGLRLNRVGTLGKGADVTS